MAEQDLPVLTITHNANMVASPEDGWRQVGDLGELVVSQIAAPTIEDAFKLVEMLKDLPTGSIQLVTIDHESETRSAWIECPICNEFHDVLDSYEAMREGLDEFRSGVAKVCPFATAETIVTIEYRADRTSAPKGFTATFVPIGVAGHAWARFPDPYAAEEAIAPIIDDDGVGQIIISSKEIDGRCLVVMWNWCEHHNELEGGTPSVTTLERPI